jgi:hypothetical protein
MQVVDSLTFFQHAGMAVPEAYDALLTECREVVQCQLRVVQGSPGAKHSALAAAVQQLARDSLASSCVEVRTHRWRRDDALVKMRPRAYPATS